MKKLIIIAIIIMFVFLTGCLETTRLAVRDPRIQITDMVFCVGQPRGYQDYEKKPTNRFLPNQTGWMYVEFRNIEMVDGVIWVMAHDTICDEKGNVIQPTMEILNYHDYMPPTRTIDTLYITVRFVFKTLNLSPGSYIYEIELIDGYTGKSDKRKLDFVIVGGRDC